MMGRRFEALLAALSESLALQMTPRSVRVPGGPSVDRSLSKKSVVVAEVS